MWIKWYTKQKGYNMYFKNKFAYIIIEYHIKINIGLYTYIYNRGIRMWKTYVRHVSFSLWSIWIGNFIKGWVEIEWNLDEGKFEVEWNNHCGLEFDFSRICDFCLTIFILPAWQKKNISSFCDKTKNVYTLNGFDVKDLNEFLCK
jgi:hypothetical protein